MNVYGTPAYDWVNPHSTRTPSDYPYGHSEYFLWREFQRDDRSVEFYYTDRMRSWDGPKYAAATKDLMTNFGSVPRTKADAQKIVNAYFGPDAKCVGVIQSMNVSSGYPLGVFCIRRAGAGK